MAMMGVRRQIDYDELVKEDRVNSIVHSDPEIFEEEMEKIFHRGWVYVGHESEIPEPGDYRTGWIGKQPVIMTRTQDGEIHLLINRCRHRANTVCQHDKGNANFFRCAYHGWTYKNNGNLVGVTYETGYPPSFRKEEYGLTHVPRVESYRGLIFGSLSPTGMTLDQHLGERVKAEIDMFMDLSPEGEVDARHGCHKSAYQGNWKMSQENAMDGYHPHFVHQSLYDEVQRKTGVKDQSCSGESNARALYFGNGHAMLDGRPYKKVHRDPLAQAVRQESWGQPYVEAMEKRYGKERAADLLTFPGLSGGGTHLIIFPNLMLIAEQIRVVRPISPQYTEVYRYFARLKGVPDQLNEMRLRAHEFFFGPATTGGSPEDEEMMIRNQIGMSAQVDPWLLLARGLHREEQEPDGTLVGQITDEVALRGWWRHWKEVMSEA